MRSLSGGLRGRLLAALVATSLLTLAVAAYALVDPLTERLREDNVQNLRTEALAARPDFQRALRDPERRRTQALELQKRASARVVIASPADGTDFTFDTDVGAPTRDPQRLVLRALRLRGSVLQVEDERAFVAIRLFDARGSVLVAERQLTDVQRTVAQVRNALLTAGAFGLLAAIVLSVAISTALLRRLGRLRATVSRITETGPEAPPPRDDGRDEIGDLARAFATMQEALRREEASRRSFVATASHELRTPLTMLQGTMELLEEDLRHEHADLPDAREQVAGARRELRRLTSLAGELLDLSRLDAQVPLRSEAVELGEIARAVAAEFALPAGEHGDTGLAEPPRGPALALGDPDATARIVRILVDNAVRHAPARTTVRLRVRGTRVEVADQGPGVLPQDRERIFERFYRAEESSAESGFGLGLAIGRGLAEQMGGTLALTGDGAGGRFELALPSAPDEDGRLDGVGPLGEGRGGLDRGDREAGVLR